MPPDSNNVHAVLGEHEAKLDAHRREIDGLWRKDDEHREKLEEHNERLVKVRIQVAVIVALGMILGGLLQTMSNRFVVAAVERMTHERKD